VDEEQVGALGGQVALHVGHGPRHRPLPAQPPRGLRVVERPLALQVLELRLAEEGRRVEAATSSPVSMDVCDGSVLLGMIVVARSV
jgi:hypothetical protein